jgi:hypothetical protein
MMIYIPLTRGQTAIIDDEDADLATLKWYAMPVGRTFYARRNVTTGRGVQGCELLHAVIARRMGLVAETDHHDHDGLNCRRSNLRSATRAQNCRNTRIRSDSRSGFKGVARVHDLRWRTHIKIDGRQVSWSYPTAVAAALAYDRAAAKHYGEFACLNFRVDPRTESLIRFIASGSELPQELRTESIKAVG